jgi:hypothetical protein
MTAWKACHDLVISAFQMIRARPADPSSRSAYTEKLICGKAQLLAPNPPASAARYHFGSEDRVFFHRPSSLRNPAESSMVYR